MRKKELYELCKKNDLTIHKKTSKNKIINSLINADELEEISDFEDSN